MIDCAGKHSTLFTGSEPNIVSLVMPFCNVLIMTTLPKCQDGRTGSCHFDFNLIRCVHPSARILKVTSFWDCIQVSIIRVIRYTLQIIVNFSYFGKVVNTKCKYWKIGAKMPVSYSQHLKIKSIKQCFFFTLLFFSFFQTNSEKVPNYQITYGKNEQNLLISCPSVSARTQCWAVLGFSTCRVCFKCSQP